MICKCEKCNREFERNFLEEHHLIPIMVLEKRLGDRLRILLCKDCHTYCTDKLQTEKLIWLPKNKFLKIYNQND